MKTVKDIVRFFQTENNALGLEMPITGICQDSRCVQEGFLFACVRGKNADGHDFAPDVIKAGAQALLVERYLPYDVPQIKVDDVRAVVGDLAAFLYDWPAEKMLMVGVTGTNGKTTVTSLVKQIAGCCGYEPGCIGTLGVEINNRLSPGSHTTPEAVDLQATLSRMVDEGVNLVAMEVSSHALHQGRMNGCAFDAIIFTNLTQDHLDYHGTMEAYLEAKTLAFSRGDFNKSGGMALLNGDDVSGVHLKSKAVARVVTYGIEADQLDYRARNVVMSDAGAAFDVIRCENNEHSFLGRVHAQTPGRFSIYNALAAFAWAMESGLERQGILAALAEGGVPGRFESVRCGQDFQVIVDYAHTPDGLINVLATAREITSGRLICVFGCGGDRDRTKRPLMGRAAAEGSDYAIVTSDNPRTECPLAIIEDILPGLQAGLRETDAAARLSLTDPAGFYEIMPDRYSAIEAACRLARAEDTVVIAGKGHEDYQILGTDKIHFDDREAAAEIIAALLPEQG